MRIELSIDGGFACFPGLARPLVLDGAHLSAADLAELTRLCRDALAAALPDVAPAEALPDAAPAEALPDARRYRLAIDIDGERHELAAADPVAQPAVAALIDFVAGHGKR